MNCLNNKVLNNPLDTFNNRELFHFYNFTQIYMEREKIHNFVSPPTKEGFKGLFIFFPSPYPSPIPRFHDQTHL